MIILIKYNHGYNALYTSLSPGGSPSCPSPCILDLIKGILFSPPLTVIGGGIDCQQLFLPQEVVEDYQPLQWSADYCPASLLRVAGG